MRFMTGLLSGWYLRAPAAGRAARRRGSAGLWRALAAILREVAEQRVHGVVARGVDHRPPFAPHGDEPGLAQAVEVERQRVRRQPDRVRHLSGGNAFRSRLHQQAVGFEAMLLRKRSERRDGVGFPHCSTIIEMSRRESNNISISVELFLPQALLPGRVL